MNRKLINYLPPYVQEYKEIQTIMNVEQALVSKCWDNIDIVECNQFIKTATAYGCSRWEGILGITARTGDTLDERRFRIIAFLNVQLPFTMLRLKQMLTALCGVGKYAVYLYNNEYSLIVKLALANEKNYNDVSDMLRTVVPANLDYKIYMFNMHKVLRPYRHSELRAHTHYGVRTDVFQ